MTKPPLFTLIIEDNDQDAELLLLELRRLDYNVISQQVKNRAELQAALDQETWDLALSDHALPGFSSLEALELIRKRRPDLPCIIVSGRIGEDGAVAVMRAGADDYVNKDQLHRLGPALERTLRERDMRRRYQRAQALLAESDVRFHNVVESLSEGLLLTDAEATIFFANSKLVELTGYSVEEMFGQKVHELFFPQAQREKVLEYHRACMTGESRRLEYHLRRKDREHRWVQISTSPLRNAKGEITGVLGTCTDITERKRAEENLRLLDSGIQQATDAVIITEAALEPPGPKIVFVNPAFERMTGYSAEELIGRTPRMLQGPDTDWDMLKRLKACLRKGSSFSSETVNYRKDGRAYYVEWSIAPLRDDKDRVTHFVAVQRDITERRTQEMEFRKLSQALEQSPSIVVMTDTEGAIEYVNESFSRITGYILDEVRGKSTSLLKSDFTDEQTYKALWQTIQAGEDWHGEFRNRKKDGSFYWEAATISPVKDAQGVIINFLKLAEDITEHKSLTARLEHLAYHDPLTHLPNRTLLQDRLEQAVARTKRSEKSFAALYLDLDNFKVVNDSMGHNFGDSLLREVAARLQRCVRDDDTVARWGGDEFVLLLNALRQPEDAATIAHKVFESLSHPVELDEQKIHVNATLGIALYPQDAETTDDLLKHADIAMFRAKERGKNTYQFFVPAMNEHATKRLRLEQDLRLALEHEGELILHYQPRICLDSGDVIGAEALVRWQHPQHGLISPGEFIPVAEETGLINPLGEIVLRQAAKQAKAWTQLCKRLKRFKIAVNLSAKQLQRFDIVSEIAHILTDAKLDPVRLELEITESALMNNIQDSRVKLRDLKALGVSIAVDDFGTAYSSLNYLKRLPIDNLKIDQSFVRDLGHHPDAHPNDAAIVRAIVALAKSLELGVIAEGVETEAQRVFLLGLECYQGQGFLFSRPLTVESFEQLLWQDVPRISPDAAD